MLAQYAFAAKGLVIAGLLAVLIFFVWDYTSTKSQLSVASEKAELLNQDLTKARDDAELAALQMGKLESKQKKANASLQKFQSHVKMKLSASGAESNPEEFVKQLNLEFQSLLICIESVGEQNEC